MSRASTSLSTTIQRAPVSFFIMAPLYAKAP
jgi:hypothetical protein